jgi:hypothetical protein
MTLLDDTPEHNLVDALHVDADAPFGSPFAKLITGSTFYVEGSRHIFGGRNGLRICSRGHT